MTAEESLRLTRDQGWTGGRNPWLIAIVVSLATFMEFLDTGIANVSLAHIAGSLSVTQDESTWVITSYLMANAIVLPISGWLAVRIGRKRYYMGSVIAFIASSFLCGIAPNLAALIFFRILQGLGGGGLGPSEQAILADTFPAAKRAMGVALYGMAVVIAPVIAPTLGGFITDHYSWRWIFLINVPVGITSLLLCSRILVDPPHLLEMKRTARRIDSAGLSLIAVGLGALEIVLSKGQENDWFASRFISFFAGLAVLALIAFAVWEWHTDHPVVDVRLFRSRGFTLAMLMMLGLGIAIYAPTVLLPQYTQTIMNWTAQQAGMALSPGGLVMLFMLPLVGRLATRFDPRYLIAIGFATIAIALWHIGHTLYPEIAFSTAAWLRVSQTLGIPFLFVSINAIAYSGVSPAKSNQVSGIVNLMRNVGGDIGISLVTTLIARRAQVHQARLVEHLDSTNTLLSSRLADIAHRLSEAGVGPVDAARKAAALFYRQVVQQAQTLAYLDAFIVLAVLMALLGTAALLTKRPVLAPAPAAH